MKKPMNVKEELFVLKNVMKIIRRNFEVEIYNGVPIYCVEIKGEKRYMPYLEAAYYFKTIEECRERLNSNSALMPIGLPMLEQ